MTITIYCVLLACIVALANFELWLTVLEQPDPVLTEIAWVDTVAHGIIFATAVGVAIAQWVE